MIIGRRLRLQVLAGIAAATTAACGPGHAGGTARLDGGEILPTGLGEAVDREVARATRATEAFRDLDRAVAAGYPRRVRRCIENQPEGGMGYHHQKPELVDSIIEVERPEILLYGYGVDGEYKMYGIEYVVPIASWARPDPPEVMGRSLKRSDDLGLWYLHVWTVRPNPSGIFADWNPSVTC